MSFPCCNRIRQLLYLNNVLCYPLNHHRISVCKTDIQAIYLTTRFTFKESWMLSNFLPTKDYQLRKLSNTLDDHQTWLLDTKRCYQVDYFENENCVEYLWLSNLDQFTVNGRSSSYISYKVQEITTKCLSWFFFLAYPQISVMI